MLVVWWHVVACLLLAYIVLLYIAAWLVRGEVQKFVVVITGADTKVVLERWVFNVETDKSVRPDG